MTTTAIRPAESTVTPESERLAELARQIEQTVIALRNPQGWAAELSAQLRELKDARAEMLALVAGAALGA
jgi:hypothetical protein